MLNIKLTSLKARSEDF